MLLSAGELQGGSDCRRQASSSFAWRTSDPRIAEIDSRGHLRAREPGWVQITATRGGREAVDSFQVIPPVSRVEILPGDTTVAVGDTLHYRAVVFDRAGHEIPGVRMFFWDEEIGDSLHFRRRRRSDEYLLWAAGPSEGMVTAQMVGRVDTVRVRFRERT